MCMYKNIIFFILNIIWGRSKIMIIPMVAGFLAGLGVSDLSKNKKFSGTCLCALSALLVLVSVGIL